MKIRSITTIGLTVILALMLSACAAGKKQFNIGMQLGQQGKYKDAIAYLQNALKQEPDNQAYKDALADYQNKLIGVYLSEADKALGPKNTVTMANINRATVKLDMARDVDPENPAVTAFADKLKSTEKGLIEEVKALYNDAKTAHDGQEWLKAYFNLQRIQRKFPNYEDSARLMADTATKGADMYYSQAKEQFGKDNFKEVGELLRKALALNPDSTKARKMLAEAQQNDNKAYFVKKGGNAIMKKQWDAAVKAYTRALAYEPTDEKLKNLIDQVTSQAGDFYIQAAKQQMDAGWLLKAFETYALAAKYTASSDDYQLRSLRDDLTARAALLANQFQQKERYGSAWFWYRRIRELNPAFPDIFYLTQTMEDRIKDRVRKSIAVFDFSSPAGNKDAGVIVANNLITYLFNNASGDIKILERENLKSILEEMKLGQIGVVSSSSAKEMGRVYGIDVAIMGSVLLYKVDSQVSNGTKTIRYKVGTRMEDNIDYQNWLAKNPHPDADQLAAAPPAKIMIPQYAEKDYQVSQHKKIGFIQVSFRIVDVTTGENIQVKTIERTETAEDETSAGLPEAGIKYDPLEIATNTQILQKLTNEVVAELGYEALQPMQNLEQVYFNEGEKYLRRRDNLNAAERFVNAIFDEQLKRIVGSPLTAKANEYLHDIFIKYQAKLEG